MTNNTPQSRAGKTSASVDQGRRYYREGSRMTPHQGLEHTARSVLFEMGLPEQGQVPGNTHQEFCFGTSLVVQRLRLCAPTAGDLGLIPGQGVRSHKPQLKSSHAATKTQHNQINK